jgi:hypothetical protein
MFFQGIRWVFKAVRLIFSGANKETEAYVEQAKE